MSGNSSSGKGEDPSYYYNIERDRQNAAMLDAQAAARKQEDLVREQMAQQRQIADRVAVQQDEQLKVVQAETDRVAAERAAQEAENLKVKQATDERRRQRTLGGVQSFATAGYGGFGGIGRTLGSAVTLG